MSLEYDLARMSGVALLLGLGCWLEDAIRSRRWRAMLLLSLCIVGLVVFFVFVRPGPS